MSVVTKTGDDGKSRWNNQVVEKDSELLEAIGTIDELMAVLGTEIERDPQRREYMLSIINRYLYRISGVLAGFEVSEKEYFEMMVEEIENEIKKKEDELDRRGEFLTAGIQLEANMNWARTVCRRAERRLVTLNKVSPIDPNILKYINRLSDYLFLEARKD